MKNKIAEIAKSIAKLTGPQFASFTYVPKSGEGEVARYTVNLGFSYKNSLEKSKTDLEVLMNDMDKSSLQFVAATELMASINESIEKGKIGEQNDAYTKKGQYLSIANGLNLNTTDNTYQLFGLVISKKVLTEGAPRKKVNSAPKTVEKNKLRKQLALSKFREFALDEATVESVRIGGIEITNDSFVFEVNKTDTKVAVNSDLVTA